MFSWHSFSQVCDVGMRAVLAAAEQAMRVHPRNWLRQAAGCAPWRGDRPAERSEAGQTGVGHLAQRFSKSQTSWKPIILQNSLKSNMSCSGVWLRPLSFSVRSAFSIAAAATRLVIDG